MIFTGSALDALVCRAKFKDAMKVRYGKAGPARQGQAFHRWWDLYATHLFTTKRDSDFEAARAFWDKLRPQLSADDEDGIAECIETACEQSYPWVANAEWLETEKQVFVTVPDKTVVPADRVHMLTSPIYRATADTVWKGEGPMACEAKLHCLDWKTHRKITHVTAPSENRQLRRYITVIFATQEGDVAAWLGFPRRDYFEHSIIPHGEREQDWRLLICEAIEVAERELAAPDDRTVGEHCLTCDLRRGCDAAERYPMELLSAVNATPAQKLVAYRLTREMLKDYANALKAVLGKVPVIEDDDVTATFKVSEELKFTRKALRDVLGNHLPDDMLDELLRATKTSVLRGLQKVGMKYKAREEMLELLRKHGGGERRLISKLKVTRIERARPAAAPQEDDGEAEFDP